MNFNFVNYLYLFNLLILNQKTQLQFDYLECAKKNMISEKPSYLSLQMNPSYIYIYIYIYIPVINVDSELMH